MTATLARSPLRYPGGKQKAVREIAAMLPPGRFAEYREPMCGGASVFFMLKQMGKAEHYWINDAFKELIIFWLHASDPVLNDYLREKLEVILSVIAKEPALARDYFEQFRVMRYPSEENYIPGEFALLARAFYYLNRVTFSGTTQAGGFSQHAAMKRFTKSAIDRLAPLPDALKGVDITNLDWLEVVAHPGENVFMFLDPPYFKAKKLYGRDGKLHQFDHRLLSQHLQESPHKWLLTVDDCERAHAVYGSIPGVTIKPWSLQYGMNNCGADGKSKKGNELFIYNY